MIGIYCITNPNNKIYIGSSKNINRRWNQYKNLSCKNQKGIYSSLIKYGVDNHKFEIIYECTKEELLDKEQMFLDFYKPTLNCSTKATNNVLYGEDNPKWKGGVKKNSEYQKNYQHEYYLKNKERKSKYYAERWILGLTSKQIKAGEL